MEQELKKTPIYESHVTRGGQIVDFAGWALPVRFKNLREEHAHVRDKVGIFDVSHMGEIRVTGSEALTTLQWLTTNDVSRLQKGQAQYTLFPNSQGGIVDDLIVYCIEPNQDYLLCVNGANIEKDYQFMLANNRGAKIENQSDQWGQIAVQGPLAIQTLNQVFGQSFSDLPGFQFLPLDYKGELCYVARTGYTGEDGAEIFVPSHLTRDLWEVFLKTPDVEPIGLGARDTLRTEMKYPLYGQDINDQTFPHEAGLGWVVKFDKGDFLGATPMRKAFETGLKRKLVGLLLLTPGIARPGCEVFSIDSKQAGVVTSGTLSPSLNQAIAIAYVSPDLAGIGSKVLVQVRNKMIEAKVVKTPFYKKG